MVKRTRLSQGGIKTWKGRHHLESFSARPVRPPPARPLKGTPHWAQLSHVRGDGNRPHLDRDLPHLAPPSGSIKQHDPFALAPSWPSLMWFFSGVHGLAMPRPMPRASSRSASSRPPRASSRSAKFHPSERRSSRMGKFHSGCSELWEGSSKNAAVLLTLPFSRPVRNASGEL